MNYPSAKGVFDILPTAPEDEAWRETSRWLYLEKILRQTAHDYGYHEIRTPLFERTELFIRGVGEGTDIVTKEMYTFMDKGDRSITLRPEGTASVIRAFVENKIYAHPGLYKYFYLGPMFRYERPQAGRYRQHHQFGAEALGNATPEQDVELIDMLCETYRRLGLTHLTVCINSVGDPESRARYREALKTYFTPYLSELSKDSQERFSKNILRILDSKDPADQKIARSAPNILDHLSPETKEHFNQVLDLLSLLKIPFTVQPTLVRGLDYYNKTVFEITAGELGAQNSLGGGGRYDGLVEAIGGPKLPSIGFGTGLERVLQTMIKQGVIFPTAPHPLIFLIPMGEKALRYCFELACQLRHEKIPTEIDLSGKKVQQGMALASLLKADYAVVIGENELASQRIALKTMTTRETTEIALADLVSTLKLLKN